MASSLSGSSFIAATNVSSPFRTPFFNCNAEICWGSLVPLRETGTTQGSSPPIIHREFKNGIGTNFAACINSIPRITWKSSSGTAIMLVVPLQVPILMGIPFANPEIRLASEFTAFIRLGLFSKVNPSRCASRSAMKLWVAPVSTIAQVVWPFSLMSTYISSLRPAFCAFVFMFSPT